MANTYDISIEQGSTFSLAINAQDSQGNYLNLSGYSVRGYVKYNYGCSGYLINLNPTIDTSYISGLINISIPGTGLTGIPVTKGVYDVEVYNESGYVFKVLKGYAEISPEVTTYSY